MRGLVTATHPLALADIDVGRYAFAIHVNDIAVMDVPPRGFLVASLFLVGTQGRGEVTRVLSGRDA